MSDVLVNVLQRKAGNYDRGSCHSSIGFNAQSMSIVYVNAMLLQRQSPSVIDASTSTLPPPVVAMLCQGMAEQM